MSQKKLTNTSPHLHLTWQNGTREWAKELLSIPSPPPMFSFWSCWREGRLRMRMEMSVQRPTAHNVDFSAPSVRGVMSRQATSFSSSALLWQKDRFSTLQILSSSTGTLWHIKWASTIFHPWQSWTARGNAFSQWTLCTQHLLDSPERPIEEG